jgi:hypothetical protein
MVKKIVDLFTKDHHAASENRDHLLKAFTRKVPLLQLTVLGTHQDWSKVVPDYGRSGRQGGHGVGFDCCYGRRKAARESSEKEASYAAKTFSQVC